MKAAIALIPSLLGLAAAATVEPIVMKGSKFFFQNGTQFFMKGVAYQEDSQAGGASTNMTTFMDPLASPEKCRRDVPLLQDLGTNVIRTYFIDPTADHTECMSLLQDAGIYVISDLSSPAESINRDDPSWTTDLFKRYTDVIDELSKYDNVIGFFAGNEVTNNNSNTEASAFVKAAVRDTKTYIAQNFDRWMGVGYSANDDADIRSDISYYFNCGNQSEAIDYWGYNIYEWCGESTFETSGYQAQTDFFRSYSVPVFFSEYGCNNPGGAEGRIFQEVEAIYGDEMSDVVVGGIVYMWFQETNDYGLVSIEGSSVSIMAGYTSLSSRLAEVSPSSVSSDEYTPTNSPAACPSVGENWAVRGEVLPPTPDAELCDCMFNTLSCVPDVGLDTSAYGDIFGYICGQDPNACAGISGNTSRGVYGAYIMCNTTVQLGHVLDQYYRNQDSAPSACDFSGQAIVTRAAATASGCSAKLAEASSSNNAAASGGSGSSTSDNFGAPSMSTLRVGYGNIAMGLYAVIAMLTGAAVILL